MPKSDYVRDQRRFFPRMTFQQSRHSVILRIAVILALLALLSFGVYKGVTVTARNSVVKSYENFIAACDQMDYASAIAIYHQTQETVLTKSPLILYQEERKARLLRMEEKVNELVEIPFTNLIVSQIPFSVADLLLIEEFQELSSRKITLLTASYMEDYLLGKFKKETVVRAFMELKKVESLSDIVIQYESSLDQIAAFSETMIQIDNDFKEKNYLVAATKSKEEIGKQTGFIKDYLNRFYLDCKNEMYPVIKNDIDVMMTGSKYYSAKSLIDQMIVFFPQDNYLTDSLKKCEANVTKKLVEYLQPVEHIALRPLIATPSLAFDNDSYAKNAEDLMITTDEFRKILQQLYQNNFILIDINTLVNSAGQKNRLFFPEGKKPLILSIEGLNYYAGRSKSGNSENLVLDSEGKVASTYRAVNGEMVTDRNGEAIGILEQFIENHPDFSFDGSKGNISLTGFECVFGMVTNEDQVDDRTKAYADNQLAPFFITPQEIAANRVKALAIIQKLKNNGWTFSSSTYGNILVADTTQELLQKDIEKWMDQVGALTGPVKVLLFPSGSIVTSKNPKGSYLISKGFQIQAGIGPWAYFNFSGTHLYMDRISLNGLAFRFQDLRRFFDVKTVYDSRRTKLLAK